MKCAAQDYSSLIKKLKDSAFNHNFRFFCNLNIKELDFLLYLLLESNNGGVFP